MYYFPDLDETTRLLMISELELDIKNGLFYEPVTMQKSIIPVYKRVLKNTFTGGNVETLRTGFTMSMFKPKDKKGRKITPSIKEMIAFSDFNRYYIRALLVRAISEGKSLAVYRAKQTVNERMESKLSLGKIYSGKTQLQQLLTITRDYRVLFNLNPPLEILKPNSGLSVTLID